MIDSYSTGVLQTRICTARTEEDFRTGRERRLGEALLNKPGLAPDLCCRSKSANLCTNQISNNDTEQHTGSCLPHACTCGIWIDCSNSGQAMFEVDDVRTLTKRSRMKCNECPKNAIALWCSHSHTLFQELGRASNLLLDEHIVLTC